MENWSFVKELIENKIQGSEVHVRDLTGTNDHIGLLVVSDTFKSQTLIQQHQTVMDILKESLKERIHAVQIKTMTKEKYLTRK